MRISEYRAKHFRDYKTYVGVKEIDETKKAGFVLLFENDSEIADRSYKVEVYGMGNMNRIKKVALTVMNSFLVLW